MNKKALLSRGSILLESVIALSVIMVVIAAISTVVTISVSNSTFVKNQNQANKYAQEAMEYVRHVKENNYTQFEGMLPISTSTSREFCFDDTFALQDASTYPCDTDAILSQGFKRLVTINRSCDLTNSNPSLNDPNDALVTVQVSWSSGRCDTTDRFCHKAEFRSCLPPPPSDRKL